MYHVTINYRTGKVQLVNFSNSVSAHKFRLACLSDHDVLNVTVQYW